MFLGFLFRRKRIALEFTGTHIRIARGEEHGNDLKIFEHAESELKGTPNEIQNILKSAKLTSVNDCTLLLPPSWIYTCLIENKEPHLQQKRLREDIAKFIPEDINELIIQTKTLPANAGTSMVGVAAISKNKRKHIEDLCSDAKLHIACITTLPCILASRFQQGALRDGIVVTCIERSPITVTLFYRGFPIDESILPPPTSSTDVAKEVKNLLTEYQQRKIFKEGTVLVYGPETLLHACKEIAQWNVMPAFPKATTAELPWLGLAAACTSRPGSVAINLAIST